MKLLVRELKADVEAIALPNGRRVGTVGHAEVEKYLAKRLVSVQSLLSLSV